MTNMHPDDYFARLLIIEFDFGHRLDEDHDGYFYCRNCDCKIVSISIDPPMTCEEVQVMKVLNK